MVDVDEKNKNKKYNGCYKTSTYHPSSSTYFKKVSKVNYVHIVYLPTYTNISFSMQSNSA